MAHFAKLDQNNVVLDVCAVNNDVITVGGVESEAAGIDFLKMISGHDSWKQTSYNCSFRKNFAGVGHTYDPARDAFIPPSPYASWIFDDAVCGWNPPVPCPNDGTTYSWDETTRSWLSIVV